MKKMTALDALNKYFGYTNFRPGQEEIINSIISGENVLAVLPTGAGKSICYQIPALLSQSFSIVISPLIALMKDQVDSLNKVEVVASFVNSTLDFRSSEEVLRQVASKKIKILYLSPEKLGNLQFVEKLRQLAPEYIFVDEAHCISEWGYNFRPSYRKIFEFVNNLGIKKISAFTATATEEVRKDIIDQLRINSPRVFVRGFERENLALNVIASTQKKEKVLELLKQNRTPAIIYTATRNAAEELSEFLSKGNINSAYYHAGIATEMKRIIQDDFMNDRVKIICATNAFGMGIDKNDIRMVVHYNMPGSIENYYQEIGRAGRDGNYSKVFLLFEERDVQIQEYFINSSSPSRDQIELVYDCICDYGKVSLGMLSSTPIQFDANLNTLFDLKKLSNGIVQSAIKVLTESNYLAFKSELNSNHSVKFVLAPTQLKSFVLSFANAAHKDILLFLAKSFSSKVFSEFCRIDINQLCQNLETSEEEIINDLEELYRAGIIEYKRPNKNPNIQLVQHRVLARALKLDLMHLKSVKKKMQDKLEQMEKFVSTDECRMSFILQYFGQDSKSYKCGKCDNCTTGNSNITFDYLDEIILNTLHEAKRALRQKTLLQILLGDERYVNLKKYSSFGSCTHFTKIQIEEAILQLQLKKKILTNNEMIKLSTLGESHFIDEVNNHSTKQLAEYEAELQLFNKLRQIRKEASDKFGQMPHLICTDEILRSIARSKPRSYSDLLNVAGFNQRMFNKIGDEILAAFKTLKNERGISEDSSTKNLPKKSKLILELIEKKYTLQEISELARISESLLSVQLEGLINLIPELDISHLISTEEFEMINDKINDGLFDLKELKNALGGKISYAKIRLVLAKRNSI